MSVPGSVQQFLSVAVPVVLNFVLFLLLAACMVINGRNPKIVAPLAPDSRVGRAKNICAWIAAVCALREEDVREKGGLEAVLQARRVRMRVRICFVWVLLGIPVAIAYAVNPIGGRTKAGFDRITFQNANFVRKNTGVYHGGDRWWKNITCVVGAYLMALLAFPIIDAFDARATQEILDDASQAPLQHYAVVVTGIEEAFRDESTLRGIFQSALGSDAVVRVDLVKDFSVKPASVVDEKEEDSNVATSMLKSAPAGLRQRYEAYNAALKAAKRADLAFEAAQGKPESSMRKMKIPVASPEEARAAARSDLEKKQRALKLGADAPDVPASGAAVVVLSSLAKATAAATAPLGIHHAWTVTPAPEPRDVIYPILEKLPTAPSEIELKASTGARLKTALYVFWSIILVGLVIAAQAILKFAEKTLSGGVKTIISLVSGLVPALVASVMMSLVATILRAINSKTRVDVWAESSLQRQTQADFVLFLEMIGFIVPLLGTSLFNGITEMGGRPLRIFTIIAGNVPVVAYYFAMLAFVKMAGFLNGMTRFVPYVVFRVMDKLLCKTDFERAALLVPKKANFVGTVGWETFVFVIAAVYVPIAPYATALAFVYLYLLYPAVRLDLACVSKTPFASHGTSWRLAVTQTVNVIFLANILQIGVLLCSNNLPHFACTLPVLLIDGYYSNKFARRYETASVHGKAKGRLPLIEASDLDKLRDPHAIAKADLHLLYAQPEATDNQNFFFAPPDDDEDLMKRQELIRAWEKRYDNPLALPAFEVFSGAGAGAVQEEAKAAKSAEVEMA
mmetsp:Transcript_2467/g.7669  ORF Transcript_2467/g.7669 Transcript_2467/m.7669 type:complete len:794 (-) Transcript_2467:252-2633(-)|eukprot:CAMPEP_0197386826 /NCGR_PEP_ID=MMETSP1165-20131217/121_1 /TAXON_ID=284809 /ORGANISM="Chrysocystis fragilis, Strain CCMP3189" /LENGTH=793 /DNA_ID=CAMNT_0042912087 /DNA_START=216 /DNA_END=2597 /DNA_ORIENTATION=-